MRCAAKTGLRMSQNEHRYRLLDYTLFNLRHSLAAQKCKSMRMDMFTSEYASMKGQAGNLVNPSSLRGTSVALFFAFASCDQCTKFTASLKSQGILRRTAGL